MATLVRLRTALLALPLLVASCAGSEPGRTPDPEEEPMEEPGGMGGTTAPRPGGNGGAGGTPRAGGSGGTQPGNGGAGGTGGTGGTAGVGAADGGAPDAGPKGDAGDAGGSDTAKPGGDGGPALGGPPVASDGCGKPNTDATGTWVEKKLKVGETDRRYWIRIPKTYDPKRAYKTVVLLHGCGDDAWRATNNIPMEKVTGEDAIVIRGYAADRCWQEKEDGPDMPYFDELVKTVQAEKCTDKARLFAVGYSSGAWFANYLDCVRAGVVRASGSLAGGIITLPAKCAGDGRTAHIYVHDTTDTVNRISGSIKARDLLLARNGCNKAETMPTASPPCVRYQGCAAGFPVDWCATTAKGHNDRQDAFVPAAVWRFFSEL